MNPLKINSMVQALCEGTPIENRRKLLACVLGAASASLVSIPSAPIAEGQLRDYFMQNVADVKATLYQINEVAPFDVERAISYAFCLFERRYGLVHKCCIAELCGENLFKGTLDKVMPEHEDCGLDVYKVKQAVNILKADAEVAI
jgi:hypothetical protein